MVDGEEKSKDGTIAAEASGKLRWQALISKTPHRLPRFQVAVVGGQAGVVPDQCHVRKQS